MARVLITEALYREVEKTFPLAEARGAIHAMMALKEQPKKGKIVGVVNRTVIKELKHGKYRFYCVAEGHVLKFGTREELEHMLIKFIRMSEKKDQQQTIDEIKKVLQTIGF